MTTERARDPIAEGRAHTDASLGAERASTDATGRTAAAAQRTLDDLIDRDRIIADDRLLKFREASDSTLAQERSASPTGDGSVAIEHHVADAGRKAEREVTDALLERERERADSVAEAVRREHEAERARLRAHREETDVLLLTERSGADVAASALTETKAALAHAHREQARRGDVLGMVTHDLRSPLCVIAMNAENIARFTGEAATRDAAQEVTRAAARMARLLTDLLDVARIDSGTLRIVKRQHDVGAFVSEVRQSYEPLFADREMTFAVDVPVPAVVASFDHDRIVQVLSNLLGNAMKFTPPRGTIGLQVEGHADQVEFVLRDSGPGIHPSALPHVFERFLQIDRDDRRGLGLGLFICEKIVQAHGGRIWAESDFGKGATFRFTLPGS